MGRLPFIIAIFLVGITAKTISPMILELFSMMKGPNPLPKLPEPIPVVQYESTWKCPDCTIEEKFVLSEIQKRTKIRDHNALATILGNVKQESKFISNIFCY